MRLLFATIHLVHALIATLLLCGCDPAPSRWAMVEKAVVITETVSPFVVTEITSPTPEPAPQPTLAPPEVSPDCTCAPGCPCRERSGEACKCDAETRERIAALPVVKAATPSEGVSKGTEELVIVSAKYCNIPGRACYAVHRVAGGMPGVRFLDVEDDAAEVSRLWHETEYRANDWDVLLVPSYIKLLDGKPVMRWEAKPNSPPMTVRGLEAMRDWQPAAGSHAVATETHKQTPATHVAPAAVKGVAPASRVIATPGAVRSGAAPILSGPVLSVGAYPAAPWCVRLDMRSVDQRGMVRDIAKGSGAVIGKQGDEFLAITAAHVINASPAPLKVWCGGRWWAGRRVKWDQRADLGLVAFKCPDPQFEPDILDLADAPPKDGDAVSMHGWIVGDVFFYRETVAHPCGVPQRFEIESRTFSGESGGVVTTGTDGSGGRLVGVISSCGIEQNPDGGDGLIVDLPAIRAFLNNGGEVSQTRETKSESLGASQPGGGAAQDVSAPSVSSR